MRLLCDVHAGDMRVLCDMLQALSQIQLGSQRVAVEAGSVGFLLWRSVYIVKQADSS